MLRIASGPSPVDGGEDRLDVASFGASGSRRRRRGGRAISGTRAAPSVNRMNDRTAASRRAIVDGASPRPAAAELGRVLRERLNVDVVERAAGPLEPAAEVGEVGRVGPPGRLGRGPGWRGSGRSLRLLHPAGFAPSSAPAFPMRSTFLVAVVLVGVVARRWLCSSSRSARRRPRRRAVEDGDAGRRFAERRHRARTSRSAAGLEDRRERPRRTSTPEGIDEIEAGRPQLSSHVVVSLGTNDPPDAVERSAPRWRACSKLVGPNRCVVWATIWRDGAPNDAFNDVLRHAAAANRRVRLVDWAEMVEEHPDWLAADGVHGNETGYRERARAVAEAVTGCAPASNGHRMTPAPTGSRTGADARLTNEDAPLAVVLVNGGSARPVPGTWSATSELLTTELAPRFPGLVFAEVRYRVKTWNALDSCLADARAALDLVARPRCSSGSRWAVPSRSGSPRTPTSSACSGSRRGFPSSCRSTASAASGSTSFTGAGTAICRGFPASAGELEAGASSGRARSGSTARTP